MAEGTKRAPRVGRYLGPLIWDGSELRLAKAPSWVLRPLKADDADDADDGVELEWPWTAATG